MLITPWFHSLSCNHALTISYCNLAKRTVIGWALRKCPVNERLVAVVEVAQTKVKVANGMSDVLSAEVGVHQGSNAVLASNSVMPMVHYVGRNAAFRC